MCDLLAWFPCTSACSNGQPAIVVNDGFWLLQESRIVAIEGEFIAMTEQISEAKAKANHQESVAIAAKEQFLRSTADFDNFRKRSVRMGR